MCISTINHFSSIREFHKRFVNYISEYKNPLFIPLRASQAILVLLACKKRESRFLSFEIFLGDFAIIWEALGAWNFGFGVRSAQFWTLKLFGFQQSTIIALWITWLSRCAASHKTDNKMQANRSDGFRNCPSCFGTWATLKYLIELFNATVESVSEFQGSTILSTTNILPVAILCAAFYSTISLRIRTGLALSCTSGDSFDLLHHIIPTTGSKQILATGSELARVISESELLYSTWSSRSSKHFKAAVESFFVKCQVWLP